MKTAALALACAAGLITLSGCDVFNRNNGNNGQQPNATPQAPGPLAPKPDANGVGPAAPAAGPAAPGGKPTPGAAPTTAPTAAPTAAPNPTAGAANDGQLRQLVSGYLDNYAGQLAQGYQRSGGHPDQIVPLQPGQTWSWAVQLQPGQTYKIIGGCDNECSDFDLTVTDPSGNQLASDLLLDDYPVLDFTATTAGTYQVQMTMAACSIAPCYAGARVYQR